jgi:aldose 1-epimerase
MVAVSSFGNFEGKRVDQFRLVSSSGVEVDLINWGCVVRDWRVPVGGKPRSVVLGFEQFDAYPAHSPYFGAVVGRVANRIRGASFELGGKTYTIPANEGTTALHGGPKSLGNQVWDAQPDDATTSVIFSITSPDGAMGFPGTVKFKATYRLDGNRLRLEFGASTDRATPLSLVQHQYFNLGTGPDVLDHTYWLRANAYTESGPDLVPTGNILEATPGSKWNWAAPKTLRDATGQPVEYDGNAVLDTGRDLREPIAIVTAPAGDVTLKLRSDRPGVQFYNGVWTDVPAGLGFGGRTYGKHSGFCLEDQMFPDALHHPHFPSIIITPDQPYVHWSEFEIG